MTGKLIVITGPSGVGKGTLIQSLKTRHPQLYLSISTTTRSPRDGEVDGQDYFFASRQQFETLIEEDQLLEWAEYAGNYYGTPRSTVEEQLNQGKQVLLEIELLGARLIQKNFPQAYRVFILPPSLEELERRLRERGTDSQEAITKRLERAQKELAAADEFDFKIINDDLEKALKCIETAIFKTSDVD